MESTGVVRGWSPVRRGRRQRDLPPPARRLLADRAELCGDIHGRRVIN